MLPITLRKAAILVSALDDRAADALLEQMGPEQAAKVRSAMMELREIPSEEEQRVLTEFLQRQSSPALDSTSQEDRAGVELELSSPPVDARLVESREQQNGNDAPLDFLAAVPAEQLARVLQTEHSQMVAAVIAHLPPELAAVVLQRLPSELATDALERMATLEPLAPAVLADLENELRSRLSLHFGTSATSNDSAKRLSAVLGAMDNRQRERVLLQLSQRNATLVERLGLYPAAESLGAADAYRATSFRYRLQRSDSSTDGGPAPKAAASRSLSAMPGLEFAELALLDDQSLRTVFAAAEPAVVLLALTGAEERLLSWILRQLPSREAAVLRQRLNHPGPLRLRDIEQAQRQLARIASQLAHEGEIRLPRAARFAAAA